MDYRKRSKKKVSKKAFSVVLTMHAFLSLAFVSLPISAYYADTAPKNQESMEEIKSEKKLNSNSTISGNFYILENCIQNQELELTPIDEYEKIELIEKDPRDTDPLMFVSKNIIEDEEDITSKINFILEKYSEYFEYNLPFTVHFDRNLSKLTDEDILIIKKIVYSEIGNCTFEQQAATAAMCLNLIFDEKFPDTMFENAIEPGRFRESYGYAPWPELSEKSELAISLALSGIDFSCNAVSFYTPEYSSEEGCKFFKECTTTTATIPSKREGETSVFACLNESKDKALSTTKYIYSKYFNSAVIYYS